MDTVVPKTVAFVRWNRRPTSVLIRDARFLDELNCYNRDTILEFLVALADRCEELERLVASYRKEKSK